MDIRPYFKNLDAKDRQKQKEALEIILKESEQEVHWVYNYWDKLEADLKNPNGTQQLRSVQILSNLALSDKKRRIFETFEIMKNVIESDTATTEREAMTYIWRIALAGPKQLEMIEEYLTERYNDESLPKMMRTSILVSLKQIAVRINNEEFNDRLEQLINSEYDIKQYKQNIKALDRIYID